MPYDFSRMTKADIARAFRVSVTTVKNWIIAGCPVKEWGKMALSEVLAWLVARDTGGLKDSATVAARRRLIEAHAAIHEVELARMRGELLPKGPTVRAWERAVMSARGKFLAYFDKVPSQVVGCSNVNEIRELMRKEGYAVLEELASADYSGCVAEIEEGDADGPGQIFLPGGGTSGSR